MRVTQQMGVFRQTQGYSATFDSDQDSMFIAISLNRGKL